MTAAADSGVAWSEILRWTHSVAGLVKAVGVDMVDDVDSVGGSY